MDSKATLGSIQKAVWAGRLPLQITLAPSESRTFDQTDPYLVRPLLVPDELGANSLRSPAPAYHTYHLFSQG